MEAQLKTMPDDIINLVLEFMPSYLKDIKIIKIVKENINKDIDIRVVDFDKSKKLWFHNRAKDNIGVSIYTFELFHKNTIYNFNKLDKPIYPLPIVPYTACRKRDGWRTHKTIPYVVKIRTILMTDSGNVKLDEEYNDSFNYLHSLYGLIRKKLQDFYNIAQLDLIAEFYGLKVPSKIKKNKTKYIQYLMKQEY